MVPEALSLQWDLPGLCTSLAWEDEALENCSVWGWSTVLMSVAQDHSQAWYNDQKTREHKSSQPPGTNKLCMPMLNPYFVCAAIHVLRWATQLHIKPLLLTSCFLENGGKVRDNPHSQIIQEKPEADKGASEARVVWVKLDQAVKEKVPVSCWWCDACFVERFLFPSLLSLGGHH